MIPQDCRNLNLPLRTARLCLRAPVPADFEDMHVMCSDPELCQYIRPPMTADQTRERLDSLLRPWSFVDGRWSALNVCLPDNDRVLGEVVFRIESRDDRRAEIGFRFQKDCQGKGYAFEATQAMVDFLFKSLHLHKLMAYRDAENEASDRLLARLGMHRAGVFREHNRRGDVWVDLVVHSLLQSDWAAARQ